VVNGGVPRLINGVAAHGVAGPHGAWNRYVVSVPRDRSLLRVTLDGPACTPVVRNCIPDLDLYVRRGFDATLSQWQCRPYLQGSDETCTVRNARSGTWHVAVNNAAAALGTPFTLTAALRR
jgi:serine protease